MTHPVLIKLTKTASEVLDYTVEWKNWLSSGEQVSSAFVVSNITTPVGISSITNMASAVSFFVGSGTVNQTYRLQNAILTNQGRQAVRTFELAIVDFRFG